MLPKTNMTTFECRDGHLVTGKDLFIWDVLESLSVVS